jgi:RNA polymerase sigma-70 factor, ECF subfamily
MTDTAGELTRLVDRWSQGDETALDRLVQFAYDDLRRIAHRHLRSTGADRTLGTTVLVHELYLRLAGVTEASWGGRAQFFAFCSKAMRRIVIDYARRRGALKRGGGRARVTLSDSAAAVDAEAVELLALDEALTKLAAHHERMARIVECRFFGGLSVPETAEAVGTSTRTVEREWARARAYLNHLLTGETAASETESSVEVET